MRDIDLETIQTNTCLYKSYG